MSAVSKLDVLLLSCVAGDFRVTLEYDTGRTIPGEKISEVLEAGGDIATHNFSEEDVQQGPKGWTISVDALQHVDEESNSLLFPTLNSAIDAGFDLLSEALADRRAGKLSKDKKNGNNET